MKPRQPCQPSRPAPCVPGAMGVALAALLIFFGRAHLSAESLGAYAVDHPEGRSVIISTQDGKRIRLTPYGHAIVRVQVVRSHEEFFPDTVNEMVVSHAWAGVLRVRRTPREVIVTPDAAEGLSVTVWKDPLRLEFRPAQGGKSYQELTDVVWSGDSICAVMLYDSTEHFTGLGHGFYGRSESLDLQGRIAERNYGTAHGQQAPLIVPFYLSSRGYGLFLNSTWPNAFCFGKDGHYEFLIRGKGQLDFFVFGGPGFPALLDAYTQLTGRPRLPPEGIFGLALSDKANDDASAHPSDEQWWKEKLLAHRNAGFPIDHLVNDNRWRAGGGKRCESYFAWDSIRYPNPHEYQSWVKEHGLLVTVDFNRCIASRSEGWRMAYNVPHAESIEFGDSAPDFTRSEVRQWFWNLFWQKTLNPALGYPGDALWIDEFDEMGTLPASTVLGNGKTWDEMRNYWFYLIAKALVQDGWDKAFGETRRPFVWVRGMTAGAQRYATLWSGDIRPTYSEMQSEVRGMLLAGMSGFPFWGHDAGGFHDWETHRGPDDVMYRQWSMALGSFTPFWKPHGMGVSRWPLDRSLDAQADARTYGNLRSALMPYLYTYAHAASSTGMPIARALVLSYQNSPEAWNADLEYLWGGEILVAPNCSESTAVALWLPPGMWYDFWSDAELPGNRTAVYPAPAGKLPLFVKAGSIIPMFSPAPGLALLHRDTLVVDLYPGTDAEFHLYEDDGETELYRTRDAYRITGMSFTQAAFRLSIAPARGHYAGSPDARAYIIQIHGLSRPVHLRVDGIRADEWISESAAKTAGHGIWWDDRRSRLQLLVPKRPVTIPVVIQADSH